MRAMMSDVTDDGGNYHSTPARMVRAAAALEEARRVLAATEPPEARRLERIDYADGHSRWYEADETDDREERCWPAPDGIRQTLIESLAAFVSAPDPAAYLASLA